MQGYPGFRFLKSETAFANGIPFKMMKNDFYFTLKCVFLLKIFNICLEFLVMLGNRFIRKTSLIQKV